MKELWGKADGKDVYLVTLSDGTLTARITNFGAAVVSLLVPDRTGKPVDVVIGYDTLEEYVGQGPYAGVIAGRCANRIKASRFQLNGEEFLLEPNEGKNHLHGGHKGFGKVVWEIDSLGSDFVVLKYLSPDGEGGYPGNLECTVEYRLEDSQLKIHYFGKADRDTIMNLTSHSYFNLNGHENGTIKNHFIRIDADRYTEVDEESIPTGNNLPVEGTPFDLKEFRKVGDMLALQHPQLVIGEGYDHNYVLNNRPGQPAAEFYSPESGIGMEVFTDLEGMHFYTASHMDGTLRGKGGAVYPRYAAACFETQHFPNAVNIPDFPSPIIKKGEEKKTITVFRFFNK